MLEIVLAYFYVLISVIVGCALVIGIMAVMFAVIVDDIYRAYIAWRDRK